jgi:hypothetical protein
MLAETLALRPNVFAIDTRCQITPTHVNAIFACLNHAGFEGGILLFAHHNPAIRIADNAGLTGANTNHVQQIGGAGRMPQSRNNNK